MATNGPKAQLSAEMDASGVRPGFEQIKRDAKDLGNALEKAGDQGDRAFKAIEEGAKASASSMSRSESAIIASITRATNRIEQAGKTASEAFAFKIDAKGLDASKFEPAIAKLREAEKAAKAFQDQLRADDAARAAAASQQQFIAGLREQIALQGKSTEEVLRYRAAQLGIGDAAAPLILQLQNQKAAQTAAAQAAKEEAEAQRAAAAAKQTAANQQQAFIAGLRDQVAIQGKSQAEVLRYRAAQLGVSKDAEAFIAQLDRGNSALGRTGISAGQTAQALRQLPAQFTDIVTSLQAGQAPLTVFLQQGGQIKDTFGGVGAALRETGKFILGLIGPVTIAVGAIAALAFAFKAGADESQAFKNTLILSGNQAGVTADQLSTIAASLAKVGVTQGAAADALNQLAATGKVGAENLGRFADTAVRLARVGGPAVAETVKAFAELGKDPLQASLKLNEATNYLTVSLYRQIKALEEQGKTTEAAKVAQEGYARAQEQRIAPLADNLGLLERAWLGVKDAIKGVYDGLLDIGRADTDAQRALKIRAELALLDKQRSKQGAAGFSSGQSDYERALEAELVLLEKQQRANAALAIQQKEQAKNVALLADFSKQSAEFADKEVRKQQELTAARNKYQRAVEEGLITEVQYRTLLANIRAKYADQGGDNELAGLRAKLKTTNDYIAALSKQGAVTRELNDGEKKAAELREQLKQNLTASVKAEKERALVIAEQLGQRQRLADGLKADIELTAKQAAEIGQQADAIRDRAASQEAANAVFGQSKTAIEALSLAELKKQALDLEATDNVDPKYLANLYAKIDAQQRFVTALKAADYKTLNNGLDEWMRSAKEQDKLYRDEQQLAGLTRLEREKILAARQVELKLAKQLAEIDKSTASADEKELLRIKARQAAEFESSAAVAKVVRDDWAKTADQIEQSLTDALVRGFDSGKGLVQSLRDYIVNAFKTTVIKLAVKTVLQGGGSAVESLGNLFGLSGLGGSAIGSSGSGGIGSLSSLLGGGSALGSFGSAFSGGYQLAGSGFGTGLDAISSGYTALLEGSGTLAGNLGQMLGAGSQLLGTIGGYVSAVKSLADGKYGAAAGSAIGTAFGGPVGAAIGSAIGSAIDKAFGSAGTPQHGAAFVSNGTTGQGVTNASSGLDRAYGASVNQYFSQPLQDALKTVTGTAAGLLNGLSTAFGGAGGFSVGAFFASDSNRDSQGNRAILQNGQVRSSWSGDGLDSDPTKGLQQLTDALAGDVHRALEQIDIPGWAKGQLEALADSAGFEELATAVQNIVATQQALQQLGASMPQLSGLADTAIEALLKAFGGIQGLGSAAQAYYNDFYTDAEKSASATAALTKELSSFGLAVPSTREAYRALVEAQDLNTESGRAAYAELLKLSPAFAALVPATQTLADASSGAAGAVTEAAQRMAEAGRKALADLADQQGSLQVDLLKAQGDVAGAAALSRQRAVAKLIEGLSAQDATAATAAYDFNEALRQQIDALNAATNASQQSAAAEAQRAAAVAQERSGLEGQVLQLQGNTAALRARELAALDPANRSLQEFIYLLQDQATAQEAANQSAQAEQQRLAAVASERAGLEGQLLSALGDTAALRQRELDAMDPSNRALQERLYAIQDEQAAAQRLAAIMQERGGLENQLLQLQGNTAALRARELAALDPSNQAIQERIYALQDEQAASQAATQASQQAAQAEAQRVAAIGSEREGLVTRLLQAQGNTAELRARELAALDPSNRELLQRIYALQDSQTADQAAAQAAQQAAQAADQLRQAWQSVVDGLLGEVQRIRGVDTNSPGSFAEAQMRFAVSSAQARAGDQDAAKLLPALSQALLALAQSQATSAFDLNLLRAKTAASLGATANALSQNFGLVIPKLATGTNEVPRDMLAMLHKGEAVVPRPYNPALSGGEGGLVDVAAEVRALREDQRVQSAALMRMQSEMNKRFKTWDQDGMPEVRAVA